MPDPARLVPAVGIAVGPVDHTPLRGPLVFAAKLDRVTGDQGHARRQIQVVGHEDAHRTQSDDEPLVPSARPVLRHHPAHTPAGLDLEIRAPRTERLAHGIDA